MAHYLQATSLKVGSMVFHVIMFIWDFLLDLVAIVRLSNDAKDLEILLLQQQPHIVERKQKRGPIIPRWQKIPLAVLAMRLEQKSDNASDTLRQTILLFKPETVVSWYWDLDRACYGLVLCQETCAERCAGSSRCLASNLSQ